MARLAFLTLEDRGNFVIDDALAIAELARRGHAVDEVPWRRPDTDFRDYAAVVIRTTWDYQRDVDGFLALLERIEALGVRLANPSRFVRWNVQKTYLRDLEQGGARIIPTRWGCGLEAAELADLPAVLGVDACVLKPVVGANADDTFRIPAGLDAATAEGIAGRYRGRAWMAQPFVRSVVDEGEYSLFYFGGVLSHAVLKRPKAGDFRVQEEHGGRIEPVEATPAMREAAERALAAAGGAPLQARVDLVRLDDGSLALMELEAIEPSLYFRMHPEAPRRFADALERWLTG